MCSRLDDPTQHDLTACPSCGAMGWVLPCSECGASGETRTIVTYSVVAGSAYGGHHRTFRLDVVDGGSLDNAVLDGLAQRGLHLTPAVLTFSAREISRRDVPVTDTYD